jgi:hypothetical protein
MNQPPLPAGRFEPTAARSEPLPGERLAAQASLSARGIPFDEQRALHYVRNGDLEVVGLFLAAGLDAGFSDADGIPAVVVAARLRHHEVCRLLLAHGAKPDGLVDAIHARATARRDTWDRLGALSGLLTVLSSVIVAAVGWHFTNAYNERQQENAIQQGARDVAIRQQQTRISEMDTVVKMIPHLTQGEQSKKAALLALSALATPDLAVQMAQLFGGVGSVQALQTIATQSPAASQPGAVSALAGIAGRPSDGEADAARAAGAALLGIFKGKERALVKLLARGQLVCNGFFAEARGALVVTPAYCVAKDTKVADLAIRMWNDEQVPVIRVERHQAIVALFVADAVNPVKLQLADATPPAGSRVLKLAYGRLLTGDPVQASDSLSVASGTVEGLGSIDAFEPNGGKRQVLHVRFADPKLGERLGEAGGPILDASGAAACMVYAGGRADGLEMCLPGPDIRAELSGRSSAN